MEELRQYNTTYNYVEDKDKLQRCILTFESRGGLKYMGQIKSLSQTRSIDIDIEDILIDGNTELYTQVLENTLRYTEMVYEIIDEMIKTEEIEVPKSDLYFEHRKIRAAERQPVSQKSIYDLLPPAMIRFYRVNIYRKESSSFNEASPERIGSLISLKGIVSRASEVHPSVWVAVYVCDQCTSEVFQEVSGESFLPITECNTERCRAGRVKGTLHLQTRPSKFRAKQVLQVQELPSDVQPGRIPRVLSVEVYEGLVRKVAPGAEILLSGVLLPKPNEGMQRMYMGLLSDSYVLGTRIVSTKKERGKKRTTEEDSKSISRAVLDHSVDLLAESIAPEIAGMADVKKLLLLMLIGGDVYTEGGMRIRGEINMLLVGDPGVAKSQLLKAVCRLSPRGVFTTGRGASGAGLTACVTRDPDTGEYRLEGGALVMSDGGVCCIDEFDKMYEGDRSCVHEAMEQHCISIAKAGINTTLNARCSVLAAANPIKGRYVDKKSVGWNAGLPSALISRFDAVRVLRDRAGKDDDSIAEHILKVHRTQGVVSGALTPEELMKEIDKRRSITTVLGNGVKERIVEAYICEREKTVRSSREGVGTARKVLSILRFAQALAKAELREEVRVEDVEEILRLLGDNDSKGVYDAILSVSGEEFEGYRILLMQDIYKEAGRFGRDEIHACIGEQTGNGAWSLNKDRLTIFRV